MLPYDKHCAHHPDRPGFGACVHCGRAYCRECLTRVAGIHYCARCLPVAAPSDRRFGVRRVSRALGLLLVLVGLLTVGSSLAALARTQRFFALAEGSLDDARNRSRLRRLAEGVEQFRSDTKRYPTPEEGLGALADDDPAKSGRRIAGWRGRHRYLGLSADDCVREGEGGREKIVDWYGREIRLVRPPESAPFLVSAGPDGIFQSQTDGSVPPREQGDDVVVPVSGPASDEASPPQESEDDGGDPDE